MNCQQVDELGAAYALGAVDPDERQQIERHLATCGQPHVDARGAAGAGSLVAVSSEPVLPSPALRRRLMATVAAIPQEHRPRPAVPTAAKPTDSMARRPGWLERTGLLRPLALGTMAATLVLAVAAGALWSQLADRNADLRAVAEAIAAGDTAYAVQGEAGSGLLIDGDDGATLVLSNLAALSGDDLYELWLIDAEGNPVAVGTHRPTAGAELTVIPLEQDPGGFATFAVTVEARRVDAPTSDPVLVARLGD